MDIFFETVKKYFSSNGISFNYAINCLEKIIYIILLFLIKYKNGMNVFHLPLI